MKSIYHISQDLIDSIDQSIKERKEFIAKKKNNILGQRLKVVHWEIAVLKYFKKSIRYYLKYTKDNTNLH